MPSIFELTEEQRLVAKTIREFVDRDVMPVAAGMEHRDEYPEALVKTMKGLGLFGLNIPEVYGGSDVNYTTFAIVFEELSRGWMGLAGIVGSHLVLCDVLVRFGTESQKTRFLPGLSKGAPGLTVSRDIDKLGYKGVETCEIHFQDFEVPDDNLIGGEEGRGFRHVM